MAYSEKAKALRRCRHVYPDGHQRAGERCRAYALWGTKEGFCAAHGGRTRGRDRLRGNRYDCRTTPVCRCRAYAWPHRPGGGLCRWPDEPIYRSTIEPGTRAPYQAPGGGDLKTEFAPTHRRVVEAGATESAPWSLPA